MKNRQAAPFRVLEEWVNLVAGNARLASRSPADVKGATPTGVAAAEATAGALDVIEAAPEEEDNFVIE